MKIRTNAQLIVELQKHDPGLEVVFHDVDGSALGIGDIGVDGTCGDEDCLRISLTDDPDDEFEAATQ